MDTFVEDISVTDQACLEASPDHADATLRQDQVLVLPMQKRMVVQYSANESGARELHLYYDDKEISFDEPELFAFGEALACNGRFRAGDARGWGAGYEWSQVRYLLEKLIEEGILERADDVSACPAPAASRSRTSLLPPAATDQARSWFECEALTEELTGRAIEIGHLELIMPIFRVAHIALDADGRQVGEANVFPRALRLDVPTEWLTCIYPGTRYLADRPMNVTALKSMRAYWPEMMAALHRIRAAFLQRFPSAAGRMTVGDIERLATLVLAIPTYQLMRCDRPVANGELHPALSSLFRVTDGLRMVMHQMLFVPIGEPTLSPHAPITSAEIHDYAERNYSFHSETGVCAGPKIMVQEFLGVLVEGRHADKYAAVVQHPAVEAALADLEAAFDYGLCGLQAYAGVFSLWPIMTRTYEDLARISGEAMRDGFAGLAAFNDRLQGHLQQMRTATYLATEAWRVEREQVYADMYEQCGRGLAQQVPLVPLPEQIAFRQVPEHAALQARIEALLARSLAGADANAAHVAALAARLTEHVVQEQAVFRVASATQAQINALLGRPAPARPFGSVEVDTHNLLQGSESRRLPYLLDEVEEGLGIRFVVDAQRIDIDEHREKAAA